MDWFIMRIVISSDIPDGLHTVQAYSLGDIVSTHATLDALQAMRDLEHSRRDRK